MPSRALSTVSDVCATGNVSDTGDLPVVEVVWMDSTHLDPPRKS
jgi:hypothetical protein